MGRIQQSDLLYDFLLPYINRSFRRAYRQVEYLHVENIPKDAAVIFAPNHANTLMDPLAVLSIADRRMVFVARADIFRHPLAARVLGFLKILPIYRIRDGVDSLQQNEAINALSVDVLRDKVPFCILPEGTHRARHGLLPLRKGIGRIALDACRQTDLPVYIVPVGLEYEDYFEYRSRLLVRLGDPIDVRAFLRAMGEDSESQQLHRLLEVLRDRMQETLVYIPDTEDYPAVWDGANALCGRASSLRERQCALQDGVSQILAGGPEVLEQARKLHDWREAAGIRVESLSGARGHLWGRGLLLGLSAPLFLLSGGILLPALALLLPLLRGLKDRAWANSIRMVTYTLFLPTFWLLGGIVLAFFIPL